MCIFTLVFASLPCENSSTQPTEKFEHYYGTADRARICPATKKLEKGSGNIYNIFKK